ncbi:MAG TPA: hypothetical protein VLB47_07935 [Solirubrobacteraceae bacterium]|nr:hypothetical protein [Solirubrobacteraceae bacterium]
MPRLHRRRPARSAPQKALHALRGIAPAAIGGKAASKASKPGRKPLGLAVAAGAAGLAFTQRDKVMAKLRGGHDEQVHAEPRQDGSV